MTVLFYRYGSICEPDIIRTLRSLAIDVFEETAEITDKNISPAQCAELISHVLKTIHPVFVFSINFFPAIAEVCHIYRIPYLCWTVDSPILELFSKSILHSTNHIFMFDKAQYEFFHPFNPGCIFHLPLASATERFDQVTAKVSASDRTKYSGDISFVGSLYTEKNPLCKISSLPEYTNGYINGIVAASLKICGSNLMEDILTDRIINDILARVPLFPSPADTIANPVRYWIAHRYIGYQAAETERIHTLNELAKHFEVNLYTRSNASLLQRVHIHNGVQSLTEMPKIFRLSKINLNITIPPIQTGLPLRIFDILGCGGFLITNYRQEISDYFEIGVDLEAYSSLEELVDKCSYYLTHEAIRQQIADNGYQKVKKMHSYQNRILKMLQVVTEK